MWQSVQLFSAKIKRTQIHVKNSDENRILSCFDCVRSVRLVQTRNRRWGGGGGLPEPEPEPSKFIIIIQVI